MEAKRPFSDADRQVTPEPVRRYIEHLEQLVLPLLAQVEQLQKRIQELESRLNRNSQNSNKPPSSDPVFKRPKEKKSKSKRKKGANRRSWSPRKSLL